MNNIDLEGPVPTAKFAAKRMLTTAEWQTRAMAHTARVQQFTGPRRQRRSRREVHPVYDFLFEYYSYSGGKLERWHPAPNELLADSAEARERFTGPVYSATDGVIRRSTSMISDAEHATLEQLLQLLSATRDRPANFGCYGMHEWAMIYGAHDVRHAEIAPLRLPQAQIDAFVESRPIVCSHFEAFRFFAPSAKPLNRVPLAWDARHASEQPGCVHANMDLYRWAYTSMPWIGSDLLWQCFELAVDLRKLDMQAGPYDLTAYGFEPVRVETPEGRHEYQLRQRELSERGGVLRAELIDCLGSLL